MVNCKAKHTEWQTGDWNLKCPNCECGELYVVDGALNSNEDCALLHSADVVGCDGLQCGYTISGRALSQAQIKLSKTHLCPTCGGSGWVTGE